jgi:hypothetical protein
MWLWWIDFHFGLGTIIHDHIDWLAILFGSTPLWCFQYCFEKQSQQVKSGQIICGNLSCYLSLLRFVRNFLACSITSQLLKKYAIIRTSSHGAQDALISCKIHKRIKDEVSFIDERPNKWFCNFGCLVIDSPPLYVSWIKNSLSLIQHYALDAMPRLYMAYHKSCKSMI